MTHETGETVNRPIRLLGGRYDGAEVMVDRKAPDLISVREDGALPALVTGEDIQPLVDGVPITLYTRVDLVNPTDNKQVEGYAHPSFMKAIQPVSTEDQS